MDIYYKKKGGLILFYDKRMVYDMIHTGKAEQRTIYKEKNFF